MGELPVGDVRVPGVGHLALGAAILYSGSPPPDRPHESANIMKSTIAARAIANTTPRDITQPSASLMDDSNRLPDDILGPDSTSNQRRDCFMRHTVG